MFRAGEQPVKIALSGCAFAMLGVAVQAAASTDITVTDCGFATGTAAIQIVAPKDEGGETALIKLTRSSFMLEPESAAVDLHTAANVTAGYCVFAAPGKALPAQPKTPDGVVLNVHKDKLATYNYAGIGGQKNAYYQVKPLAVTVNDTPTTYSFEECKANQMPATDKDAVMLAQRPWSIADHGNPWTAFGLRIGTEPALFVDGDPYVIGAQFSSDALHARRAYPESLVRSWPPAKPRPSEPVLKIWNPLATDEELLASPGTSNDLLKLLRSAGPMKSSSSSTTDFCTCPRPLNSSRAAANPASPSSRSPAINRS